MTKSEIKAIKKAFQAICKEMDRQQKTKIEVRVNGELGTAIFNVEAIDYLFI